MDSLLLYIPVLFFVLYIITYHFLHRLQNLPPTPFLTLPLIGHLYLLRNPFHRTLFRVSKRYGPVVFLKFGYRSVLLVSSPSAAEECFTKNDIVFANRPQFLSGKIFGSNYSSLAWSSYGEHWRNLRRLSSVEVLSSQRIQLFSEIRTEEVKSLMLRLFQASNQNSDTMVAMKSAVFGYTYNIIRRMLAGKRYHKDEAENLEEAMLFKELAFDTRRVISKGNILNFLPFIKWFGYRDTEGKMMEIQEKRDKFIQNVIEEHLVITNKRSTIPDEADAKKKTILDALLALQALEPDYYTDETIKSLMLVLLQAGSDSAATTLEWAFSYMLDNPKVLEKAHADIDKQVGYNRLIEESDLAELPFIRSIIYETLRMQPAAPLLVPHFSSEESTIGGFRVPRGTILLVSAWGIHHDPTVWMDPEKFKPERFEGFQGSKDLGYKFIPFGSGRRGCPGEILALRLIELALGSLIQCFDWEKSDQQMIDKSEWSGFTIAAKVQPLWAKCSPRPATVNLLSRIKFSVNNVQY